MPKTENEEKRRYMFGATVEVIEGCRVERPYQIIIRSSEIRREDYERGEHEGWKIK